MKITWKLPRKGCSDPASVGAAASEVYDAAPVEAPVAPYPNEDKGNHIDAPQVTPSVRWNAGGSAGG